MGFHLGHILHPCATAAPSRGQSSREAATALSPPASPRGMLQAPTPAACVPELSPGLSLTGHLHLGLALQQGSHAVADDAAVEAGVRAVQRGDHVPAGGSSAEPTPAPGSFPKPQLLF